MLNADIKSGLFFNKFPFISAGSGPKTIALLPQIRDSFENIRISPWSKRLLKRLSKRGHKVYIIGRRRNLPAGFTTSDMSDDYAKIFRSEIGPSSIIGISLGGLIAQHFAADYSLYTEKLVLAVSGYRINREQHENMRKWIRLAERREWKKLYLNIAYLMHTADKNDIKQWISPMLDNMIREPMPDPSDFIVSMNASLTHNTTEKTNRIKAKTLIIGGTGDILFPPPFLKETAKRISGSELCLLENTGHGAFDEKKKEFDSTVLDFICKR